MDNKLAFPNVGDGEKYDGMTLRDYFAANAMQALVTNWCKLGAGQIAVCEYSVIAKDSYEISDAMLKSRTEPKGE